MKARLLGIFSLLCTVSLLLNCFEGSGQTFTPKYTTGMGSNVVGYYEYLPVGYNDPANAGKKYPVIFYLHGGGELGSSSSNKNNLEKLKTNGLPRIIDLGGFPASFTVNNQTYSFIVICPMFINWESGNDVNGVVDYILSRPSTYRVDSSMTYMTGFSLGGGKTWEFLFSSLARSQKITAVLPIAAYCVNPALNLNNAVNVANGGVAVWALHNPSDQTASPTTCCINLVNKVNSFNPLVAAKYTVACVSDPGHTDCGHTGWNTIYDPRLYTLPGSGGLNVYQWFLTQRRGVVAPPPPPNNPPVANAGPDINITSPANTATLVGSGSDPDGGRVTFSWAKISGPAGSGLANAGSATATANNLIAGVYQFELTVRDSLDATDKDTAKVTVTNPNPNIAPVANAGSDIIINLPSTSSTLNGSGSFDSDGIISTYRWTKISGPLNYNFNDSGLASPTVSGLRTGLYQFQLTVTDNQGATDKDTVKLTVINPFPNKMPVANAGADQQLVLPTSSATLNGTPSLDSDGVIVSYSWSKIAGPSSFSITNPTAAITTVSGLAAGVYLFELKVTDDSAAVDRDTVKISISTTQRVLIDFGTSSALTGSPDANGNYWNNVTDARPGVRLSNAISTVNTATTISLEVINRIDGTFSTSGTGTNGGNTTGAVGDYPASTTSDFAFAHESTTTGKWRIFGLDATKSYSIKFWGSKTYAAARIIRIKRSDATAWQQYDAQNNTDYNRAAVFTVSGLTEVSFDIQVMSGTFGYIDLVDIAFTNPSNQPPVSKAGSDINVILPQDTAQLNGGSSVDPDGSIVKYKWTKLSGPAQGSLANDSIVNPVLKNLQAGGPGTYSYGLSVTDNGGLSSTDTVLVLVTNGGANLPPVARAGNNISIGQPADAVNGSGSASSDPDGAIASYQWRQVSGPGTAVIVNPASASTVIRGLSASSGTYTFELAVTDNNGAVGKDSIQVLEATFSFSPPTVTDLINCGKGYKIVVLGSSTAAGTGASPSDSSWVRKFTGYVKLKNASNNVVNLALGGTTTYEILCPTGFTPPGGRPAPDTAHNITKALSLNPDAIIINLPSNDAAAGFSVQEQQDNYERTMALANQSHVPVWVASSQPRNLNQSGRDNLVTMRDWIFARFGSRAVDFWSTLATSNGSINTFFDFGDGIHVNNFGHHILYTRVVGKQILDTLCILTNDAPQPKAGADQVIKLPQNSATLNGSSSADPDGSIALNRWKKIAGPGGGTIADSTAITTTVTGLTQGLYKFELRVVDNLGKEARDTMQITVNPANQLPVANAGRDTLLILPTNSVALNGGASIDPDGTIASYSWRKFSGPTAYTISDSTIVAPVISSLVPGTYQIELTVRDNLGASAKDTVMVVVSTTANLPPVAQAGSDQAITLPVSTVTLSGIGSSDPDGSISSYRWRKVAGGTASITDSTSAQTTVTALGAGTYQFALIVTDNLGATGMDTMAVIVNPSLNIPPTARAGNDTVITLPQNTVTLNGTGSADSDGSIAQYRWKKIGGPSGGSIADTTAAQTTASALGAGSYQFELTVTDNQGAKGRDTVIIIVNQPPIANAGTNRSITLPVNTIQLNGSASSDPDGSIVAYLWSRVSGPAYNINDSTVASPTVSNLVAGTYVFKLTVRDNRAASATAQVTITVNPAIVSGGRTRILIDAGPSGSTTASPDAFGKYWNNMTDGRVGVRVSNAVDTANKPTTLGLEVINRIDGTYAPNYPGTNGGNSTGIVGDYPASATNDFIFAHSSTTTGKWRIFGLDSTTSYSIKFWGSKTGGDRVIRIKPSDLSTWQQYNALNNTDYNRAATFSVSGVTEVSFDIQVLSGTFGYINVVDIIGIQGGGLQRTQNLMVQTPAMQAQSLEIASNTEDRVNLYPNPVRSEAQLVIQNAYHGPVNVILRNQYGQAIRQIPLEKTGTNISHTLLLSDLPKGLYFIQLQFGGKTSTVKFIKY